MKNLFLLSVAICYSQLLIAGDIPVLNQNYIIVSDEFSSEVPVGKCLVVGTIQETTFDYMTATREQIPLTGGLVSTLDRKKTATSDADGKFKLLLDSKDTSLFFYKKSFEEIVIWKYIFKSQHKVTINFLPGFNSSMMIVDKPVIYLYSENEINAEIKFSCKGDLTFTYPTYNESWNVIVNENQIIESGKKYPYLFWESETNELEYEIENQTMNGFLIKTDSVVDFLENSLFSLGLNSTEQTDFITFWAPRMIAKPFALVQFFVDDLYQEKISEMIIAPTPDAIRRVFMMFTPLESNETNLTILPQELNSFERKGFTVLEWGGSEISTINLIP